MAETVIAYPLNLAEYVGAEYPMLFHYGRTSGVFGAAGNLLVAASTGMTVTVSDGAGWLSDASGHGIAFRNNTESETGVKHALTAETADSTLNRIDRVVVRWYLPNYSTLPTIILRKGTAASTPAAPALVNNSEYREISLAQISVKAGVTTITAADITDERLDTTVCGIVSSDITVPTDGIEAQAEAMLDQLQAAIDSVISGTIIAHASTHASGGTDPITPASIGAAASAAGVPSGGTARQFLGKSSSTNYATAWYSVAKTGATNPTTSTAADFVGQFYVSTYTGGPFLYQCTAIDGSTYTWTQIGKQTDVNGKKTAPSQATALPTSGSALTDNTEYRVAAAVGTYAFAWPTSPFEVWLTFTTGTPSITFPEGTKYIGGAPTFGASKTYEMSVKDGVVAVAEVVAS